MASDGNRCGFRWEWVWLQMGVGVAWWEGCKSQNVLHCWFVCLLVLKHFTSIPLRSFRTRLMELLHGDGCASVTPPSLTPSAR